VVADRAVTPYDGDLDDYRRSILTARPDERDRAEPRDKLQRPRAEKRAPLKQRIAAAEAEIARITEIIGKIDTALALPDLFTRDPKQAALLSKARAAATTALEKAEEDWLEASASYDQAAG
jgi:ATP-binding cassette subfamily F protein 3